MCLEKISSFIVANDFYLKVNLTSCTFSGAVQFNLNIGKKKYCFQPNSVFKLKIYLSQKVIWSKSNYRSIASQLWLHSVFGERYKLELQEFLCNGVYLW